MKLEIEQKQPTEETPTPRLPNLTMAADAKWFDDMVATARVVYLWHNGKQHKQVEQKMRDMIAGGRDEAP